MQVHFGIELLKAEWQESIACVGTFDGVHLGHRAVISTAVDKAKEKGLPCILITFDRHPLATLAPERCPKAIASLKQNLAEFDKLGVSIAVIMPFDKALSQMTATTFLEQIIQGTLGAQMIVVGHDFALGKGREGTTEWLAERIKTHVVPPFEFESKRVSSSEIRSALEEGRIEDANQLLGRSFLISGIVVKGKQLGRDLGFPTVNLARSFDQVLPQDGVYAGTAQTTYGAYKAAISIGFRPTVRGNHRTIEAYLIDYPGNSLYGHSVVLEFEKRLREEKHFDSLEELKKQMAEDVRHTEAVLG